MHKTVVALSAVAAAVIAASAGYRAEASPLAQPGALSGAVEELALVDSVHCRPGWQHHRPNRWRRANGCARGHVIVVPGWRWVWRDGVRVRVRVGDRHHGRRDGRRHVGGDGVRSRVDIRARRDGGRRDGGMTTGRGGDGGRSGVRGGGDGGGTMGLGRGGGGGGGGGERGGPIGGGGGGGERGKGN